MEYTPVGRLLLEALVVGLAFLLLFLVVRGLVGVFAKDANTNNYVLVAEVVGAAALFHVLCEYTGINQWYCKHRP